MDHAIARLSGLESCSHVDADLEKEREVVGLILVISGLVVIEPPSLHSPARAIRQFAKDTELILLL